MAAVGGTGMSTVGTKQTKKLTFSSKTLEAARSSKQTPPSICRIVLWLVLMAGSGHSLRQVLTAALQNV